MAVFRPINKIIIHCSDFDRTHTTRDVRKWHLLNGWNDIGYHFIIEKHDTEHSRIGQVNFGRLINTVGAHCKGENYDSIGICLLGKHNFEGRQFYSLSKLCKNLIYSFNLQIDDIYPHNYFNNNKTCPNFSVENFKHKYLGDINAR